MIYRYEWYYLCEILKGENGVYVKLWISELNIALVTTNETYNRIHGYKEEEQQQHNNSTATP